MKWIYASTVFTFISLGLFAQESTKGSATENTRVILSGIVTDSAGTSGIAKATIVLSFDNTLENATSLVTRNAVADNNGRFEFKNIPYRHNYSLIVSAIGYQTLFKDISPPVAQSGDNTVSTQDIGILKLQREGEMLAGVVVTAVAEPSMRFDIDRKVFNVEKNITAQGGTAVDVMKNIPSVSVDVDGNVQMRNSSPQIFIDGRPTILTLEQIPADDIERVELITNPSAKFDASSAGGIINIVLKQNRRRGLNGIVSAGAGTPDLISGNLNLNLRQKKFNLFASGNHNRSGGIAKEETYRENKNQDTVTDYFNQLTENTRTRKFSSVRVGADYFLSNKSTISLTQSFNEGNFGNDEVQNQQFFDRLNSLRYTGLRTTNGRGAFNRSSSRLSFERRFDSPNDKFTADITFNRGNRSNRSFIVNDFYDPGGAVYAPSTNVRNDGSSNNKQFTAQFDYSNKLNENKRIEFGARSFYENSESNFATYSVDNLNNETKLPLSNRYKYTERVNAGYFNYANKWKSLTYQFGLRVELSDFDGTLVDSNLHFGYKFPDGLNNLGYSLFPSLFITKPIDENQELQFNYSKRIRRPRFWQVNPFVDINDPLNIRVGNPALKPEYTNSFEFNYFKGFRENSGNFLAVMYFKNNVGDITQYSDTISASLYDQLNNAAISPDAILNTYINAGSSNRMGVEFTLQKKLADKLDLTYNLDFQYRTTKASVNNVDLSNSGFNFGTKLITNYKIVSDKNNLFNNLGFQWIMVYDGPRVIPQGRVKPQFVSDFAMRKEFFNKKAALSFSVGDIFNSRKFGTIYNTPEFYQDSYRRWSVRTFRLTLTFKFGDADFDLFERKNNNGGGDNQPDATRDLN
jgi:outer membrane receptor protein involved in Fe transport